MPADSKGTPVKIGDTVKFRGKIYIIKDFGPKEGRYDTHIIKFEEPVHVDELPDEISIDLVKER